MNRGMLVALAIAFAAAAGFFVQRQMQATKATAAAPPIAATPAADAAADAAAATEMPAQKIPEVVPAFTLADRDGQKRSLKEWTGRPLMVNFWATWCGPCRKEIPLLNQLRKQHAARNLEIVGIAVDFREDVLKYTETNPITYPLLIGEEDGLAAMDSFGVGGGALPVTIFADGKQRIVAVRLGELHQDQADLIIGKLLAVDAGQLDIKDANQEITAGMKEISIRRAAAEAAE